MTLLGSKRGGIATHVPILTVGVDLVEHGLSHATLELTSILGHKCISSLLDLSQGFSWVVLIDVMMHTIIFFVSSSKFLFFFLFGNDLHKLHSAVLFNELIDTH